MGFDMNKYKIILSALLLLTALLFVGCDDRSPVEPSNEPATMMKIVRITTTADSIYLDGGRTFADISVYVEDEDNDPVVGATVFFKKDLGKLIASSTTDEYGVATATFYDDSNYGMATVTAYVTSPTVDNEENTVVVDEASINVKIVEVPDVANIKVDITKTIDNQEVAVTNPFINEKVNIKSTAKDSQGENVPDNTVLTYRTDKGFFENTTNGALGDSVMVLTQNGSATLTLNTGNESGECNIYIRVGNYQQKKTFTIESIASTYRIDSITATPGEIYSDNNITFSNIRVVVKDNEDYAASGVPVRFKTNNGRIIGQITTDSSGVATTAFWDDNCLKDDLNELDAKVEAVVKSYSEVNEDVVISTSRDSVIVKVKKVPPVESLFLSAIADEFRVAQTVVITASAKYTNGDDVSDNTLVAFSTTLGSFEDDSENVLGNAITVPTSNGTASIVLNTGLRADVGTVTASIFGVDPVSHQFTVKNGRPAVLEITSYLKDKDSGAIQDTTDECPVNSPYDIEIQTKVKDAYNNMCPGAAVKFLTDLGTFESQDEEIIRNSNANGIAKVNFTPGLQAGIANMTISANQDTLQSQFVFTVTSDELYSISFTTDTQIDINVAGTGGQESAILSVNLKDINGNLLNNPTVLYFWLRNSDVPSGANLNNENFGWDEDPVQVTSSGGIAQVSVNAGDESGILSVLVSTKIAHNTYINDAAAALDGAIYARKSNIVIHAGPPEVIEPFIGDFDTGDEMGGGIWRIIAGANVKDHWGNPVDFGTSVSFSLQRPADVAASIVAEAYVGNESIEGDSLAGIAYTTLTYHGTNTFDNVTVIAATVGADGEIVTGESTLQLPLNSPQIEAVAMPGELEFWPENPATGAGYQWLSVASLCKVKLSDGQGNPIDGAFITAVADRGIFVNAGAQNSPWDGGSFGPRTLDEFVPINDPENDGADVDVTNFWLNQEGNYEHGVAEFWWALNAYEIRPYDIQTFTPGQTPAQITFRLLGTAATTTTQVMVYNYSTDAALPN